MNSGISLLVQTEFFNDVIITIGVGAGGIGGIGPPTFRTGGDPPSFSDVFVTCLWCITLGLHLRTVCQCSMTAPPAARAMQGLSNRRALCVRYREINDRSVTVTVTDICRGTHTYAHSVGYNEIAIHYLNSI